ncbi:MAG TPA: hypothetical protein VKA69_00565 [Desulfobacteria bacterium]|nr:hypothetical protein [Desulfobacteria bacterium]
MNRFKTTLVAASWERCCKIPMCSSLVLAVILLGTRFVRGQGVMWQPYSHELLLKAQK